MPRPALQLALDGTLDAALRLLDAVGDRVDRIEIGTPLVVREGVHAVRKVRERLEGSHAVREGVNEVEAVREHTHAGRPVLGPVRQVPIIADLKIMDAGQEEAEVAFAAGADEVTVLAVADDETVRGSLAAARSHGGRVIADLIQVSDAAARGAQLLELGVDLLAVHVGSDAQRRELRPFDALRALREALPDAPLAVAGGIDANSAARVLPYRLHVVIVGSGIARAADPQEAARRIREALG